MTKQLGLTLAIFLLAVVLRTYQLTSSPPSLYWEEVALGYDAYSILHTGKDHHGNAWPIIAFESFGDWKPSLYFYYLVPFIAGLGLNDLAVRIAGVLAGMSVVIAVGYIAQYVRLSRQLTWLVAAVSPWSIMFSRAAWESHLATGLISWAVVFGFAAIKRQRALFMALCALLLVASMYAYHATRIIAPLMFLVMLGAYVLASMNSLSGKLVLSRSNWRSLWLPILVFAGLSLPLFWSLFLGSTEVTHRFQSTSIFTDLSIIEHSNQLKSLSGNSWLSSLLYHRYILFSVEILKNVLSYFTLEYLVLKGDEIRRHSTGFTGIMYFSELVFVFAGMMAWLRKLTYHKVILITLLVISLVPASLTSPNPHALRTLSALPVVIVLVAQGIVTVYGWALSKIQKFVRPTYLAKLVIIMIIVSVYALESTAFYRYLLKVYPADAASAWQYGYQAMILNVPPNRVTYISRSQGRPAMYYWFYTKTHPSEVQALAATSPKDQSEFLQFKNITFFTRPDEILFERETIIAASEQERAEIQERAQALGVKLSTTQTVKDQRGTVVWHILEVN